MSRGLIQTIEAQTTILFHNVDTTIATCDMSFVLCGMPIWKHVYHMLHSCDRWFINPERYIEPDFHEDGLNSLDIQSEKVLSRENLQDYLSFIKAKVFEYLEGLSDSDLSEKPIGCRHNRLALILGQCCHLYAHLGNINCTTMIETEKWPRVVGLDADMTKGLYE